MQDSPDYADSNGSAQDHADAVAMLPDVKSYFGRGYPGEVYGLRRKLAASLAANKEAAAYIAELQNRDNGTVGIPSFLTDAIKLAEGAGK